MLNLMSKITSKTRFMSFSPKGGEIRMNKSYFKKGFTLIELLVVVGILAVLAVAALIAINPLEAQRRSRDSARLQDLARITAAVEAASNDVGQLWAANQALQTSSAATPNLGVRSQNCGATNWLGVDLCQYLKQVPLDPQNGRPISVLDGTGTAAAPGRAAILRANYALTYTAASGQYRVCAYLEGATNWAILSNDGGITVNRFETGSNVGLAAAALAACPA